MSNINMMNCDCMEYMASCEDNKYDLALVDPPYGGDDAINLKNNKSLKRQASARGDYLEFENTQPPKEYFEELFRVSRKQIIFGCNFFNNYDLSGGRIVWDKKGTAFGRAEMAYYSHSKSVNIIEYVWNGMIQGDMKNKEHRIHCTQKPVQLYKLILKEYTKKGYKILDTHGGSFTHARACHDMKLDLDIMEIDKKQFDVSKKAFDLHTSQIRMF